MAKIQTNVMIEESVKLGAQELIKKYKHLDGQPVSLSELVEMCIRWYTEADNGQS